MAVNYEDPRLQAVEDERKDQLTESKEIYNDLIAESERVYKDKAAATEAWEKQQKEVQQEQTDFTIQQLEQQKQQTEKDYIKEQSAAYVDWQKQSGKYGANAEAMAAQGMAGTGYGESSQVSMYNAYQNRVAIAREAFTQAVTDLDTAIASAKMQNNAAMAEIAFNAFQQRLELTLNSLLNRQNLILGLEDKKAQINNTYDNKWLQVLDQLNTEAALVEQQRQFDANLLEEQRQFDAKRDEDTALEDAKAQIATLLAKIQELQQIGNTGNTGETDLDGAMNEQNSGNTASIPGNISLGIALTNPMGIDMSAMKNAIDGTKGTTSTPANNVGTATGGVDEYDDLKTLYPDGRITNRKVWLMLVDEYGEAKLKKMGFQFVQSGSTGGSGGPGGRINQKFEVV